MNQNNEPTHSGRARSAAALWLAIAILAAWVAAAAWWVGIEYSDGYAAISNAQYLLGIIDYYYAQRGPFVAALLMPAEWFAESMGLHPLSVRPHHMTFAFLHILYLVTLALVLSRAYRHRCSVLIAFLAAAPTYIFFSYAPFLSHDIFPGALFLIMLVAADRFVTTRRFSLWLSW